MEFRGYKLNWDRCMSCRLVFRNPQLSTAAMRRLYEESNYFGWTEDKAAAYSDYIKLITKGSHNRTSD